MIPISTIAFPVLFGPKSHARPPTRPSAAFSPELALTEDKGCANGIAIAMAQRIGLGILDGNRDHLA